MPFIDTNQSEPWERLPGWRGRFFHSDNMTFSIWNFAEGSSIHEHHHPNEEAWYVISGELEITIDGETRIAGPGMAAVIPWDGVHRVHARKSGQAFVASHPIRDDIPK